MLSVIRLCSSMRSFTSTSCLSLLSSSALNIRMYISVVIASNTAVIAKIISVIYDSTFSSISQLNRQRSSNSDSKSLSWSLISVLVLTSKAIPFSLKVSSLNTSSPLRQTISFSVLGFTIPPFANLLGYAVMPAIRHTRIVFALIRTLFLPKKLESPQAQ